MMKVDDAIRLREQFWKSKAFATFSNCTWNYWLYANATHSLTVYYNAQLNFCQQDENYNQIFLIEDEIGF